MNALRQVMTALLLLSVTMFPAHMDAHVNLDSLEMETNALVNVALHSLQCVIKIEIVPYVLLTDFQV